MGQITVGDVIIDVDDLEEMNSTELIQLCRMKNIPAHRGIEKAILISALKGKKRKKKTRKNFKIFF
jgi:hypothetical protein